MNLWVTSYECHFCEHFSRKNGFIVKKILRLSYFNPFINRDWKILKWTDSSYLQLYLSKNVEKLFQNIVYIIIFKYISQKVQNHNIRESKYPSLSLTAIYSISCRACNDNIITTRIWQCWHGLLFSRVWSSYKVSSHDKELITLD